MYSTFNVSIKHKDPIRHRQEFMRDLDPRLRWMLVNIAARARRELGVETITTCIGRTVEENRAVGGIEQSAHLYRPGYYLRAVDLRTRHMSDDAIREYLNYFKPWQAIAGLLHVKYHNSGSGNHIHVNVNHSFALKKLV